jgi:hypothetical protein
MSNTSPIESDCPSAVRTRSPPFVPFWNNGVGGASSDRWKNEVHDFLLTIVSGDGDTNHGMVCIIVVSPGGCLEGLRGTFCEVSVFVSALAR